MALILGDLCIFAIYEKAVVYEFETKNGIQLDPAFV